MKYLMSKALVFIFFISAATTASQAAESQWEANCRNLCTTTKAEGPSWQPCMNKCLGKPMSQADQAKENARIRQFMESREQNEAPKKTETLEPKEKKKKKKKVKLNNGTLCQAICGIPLFGGNDKCMKKCKGS